MTPDTRASIAIAITPNATSNPPGKLADAEIHFLVGPLQGSKLIGFAVWERRGGSGRNVTFPARQYSVNGERRSFALLRPAGPLNGNPTDLDSQVRVRELVLDAYERHDQTAARTESTTWTYDEQGANLEAVEALRSLRPGQPGTATPMPAAQPLTPPNLLALAGKAERYDYARQAWIGTDGRYLSCAHAPEMGCTCYGKLHAGELADQPQEQAGTQIAQAITQAASPRPRRF